MYSFLESFVIFCFKASNAFGCKFLASNTFLISSNSSNNSIELYSLSILYIIFILTNVMKTGFEWYYLLWALQISGIAFLIGILFLISYFKSKKLKKAKKIKLTKPTKYRK